jgi:hypothetical protein
VRLRHRRPSAEPSRDLSKTALRTTRQAYALLRAIFNTAVADELLTRKELMARMPSRGALRLATGQADDADRTGGPGPPLHAQGWPSSCHGHVAGTRRSSGEATIAGRVRRQPLTCWLPGERATGIEPA